MYDAADESFPKMRKYVLGDVAGMDLSAYPFMNWELHHVLRLANKPFKLIRLANKPFKLIGGNI